VDALTVRRVSVSLVVVGLLVVGWMAVSSRAIAASATPVVYVATGENFPDALGAASAAAVNGGPVLLVQKNSIPAETKAELSRLSPDVIYVAGGTAVVSDAVFNELKAYAGSVVRVAGANRYSTAVEVSKSAFPVTGGGGTAALEAQVAALSAEVDALQAMLSGVSRNGDILLFDGMNLQLVNGEGSTATTNGVGNLIIGYNEDATTAARTGSHYLVVGRSNDWTSYGGIVAGQGNHAAGPFATLTGGADGTASGVSSSVSGGHDNTASGVFSSVSGGSANTASDGSTSISGGHSNLADKYRASVSGGYNNTAHANYVSILGGRNIIVAVQDGTYPAP